MWTRTTAASLRARPRDGGITLSMVMSMVMSIALAFGLAACTSAGTAGSASLGASAGSGPSTGDATTSPLAAPLRISLGSETASSTIGAEGGSLEVTSAAGTSYVVNVPTGALDAPVVISATPVASLGDIGLDAQAIVLKPTGTIFTQPVTITATPTTSVPVERQLLFMFSDDGSAVWAAEPKMDTQDIVFVTNHFTGFGFADLPAGLRERYVKWTTDRAAERISSQVNETLQGERQRQLLGEGEDSTVAVDAITKAMDDYEKDVVTPRVANADTSCAAAKEAIATLLGLERQRELLGIPSSVKVGQGVPPSPLEQALKLGLKACEDEAIEKCKAAKDPSILVSFWLGANQQAQLLGQPPPFSTSNVEQRARDICDPHAYEASGGLDEFQGTGTICSLTQPFTITGDGVTHTFTPTSDKGGTYRYVGSMSGFSVKGSGTYKVNVDDKGGTLTSSFRGSVKTPMGWKSNGGAEEYTLTAIDPCD
jgi:hypothetical protein